ncbi:hypothetical protein ACT6NV_11135 [Robiginitalea sp. IMCC44478]|uniref:hypothetical protein n=1 Tax=Robiginitalea sp. IMCC44478 TaxID=3459122 RepID=UPI00404206C4
MSQDLRTLLKADREKEHPMPEGHESRFRKRLQKSFPQKRNNTPFWMGIAASVTLMLGFGIWYLLPTAEKPVEDVQTVVVRDTTQTPAALSLGDLSPDLKKLEQYYTTNINMELASLDISDENRMVADDFIARLRELDSEYKLLSKELNEIGPNEQTISAMIKNFQYRLQLLLKLKSKLNELKSTKNETVNLNSV